MDDPSNSRFWDKYIAVSRLYKVRDSALRWYVRHAKNYIKTFSGLAFMDHGPAQVDEYLRDRGRDPNLEDWQFQQLVGALEILFVEMAAAPWAKQYAWREWVTTAGTLPDNHVTLAKAYGSPGPPASDRPAEAARSIENTRGR